MFEVSVGSDATKISVFLLIELVIFEPICSNSSSISLSLKPVKTIVLSLNFSNEWVDFDSLLVDFEILFYFADLIFFSPNKLGFIFKNLSI